MFVRPRMPAPRVYLALGAWGSFAMGLISSAYALYYITRAHLGPLELVLVGTALEASAFVWEIPTGVLADSFSRRLSIIAGLAIIGVAWIGQALVPAFAAIAAFEIVRGLGEAFVSGATDAWVGGEVGDADLSRLFLRESQLSRAGGIVGLPLGVALGAIDIALPIVIGGALIVALAAWLIVVMPEQNHPRRLVGQSWRATAGTARDALWSVRASPLLLALLGAELFWGAASEGYDRLKEAQLITTFAFPPVDVAPVVALGALYMTATVVAIVTAQIARGTLVRLEPASLARVLVGMQVARVATRGLFALAPNLALALVPWLAESLFGGSFGPLYRAWLVRRTDPEVRATVLSTRSVANAFGQFTGGPASGAIGGAFGLRPALLSSALFLVPAALFFARATRHEAERPTAEVAPLPS